MFVTECSNPKCRRMFSDGPEVCGVCPGCGIENEQTDDEVSDYLNGMRG